ncbi:aquaporin AQPcic isoform X2 [Megachile rotundata]|uniref:aquaporin AQPcic isoform X2 n=1 Tax=Megachile rotundata TaxID=143995 RepID=UPI003FD36823
MEQTGISIIPTTTIADNAAGKPKSIGITLRPGDSLQAAKEKLKTPWLTNLVKEDATGWEALLFGLGEIIGTALLVFIGCTGCIASLNVTPTVLQISLTFGFAVMVAIQCTGHISDAHINPSITIAAMILGKKSLPMSLLYICCQCVGALLGYGLLKVITPGPLTYAVKDETETFCVTRIHPELSVFRAFMAEFIGTAILVLFACGVWDNRNAKNTDSTSLRFGFCIAVLCMILIPYTGCSMNPARSLSPAIWNGSWEHHWIYWLGPLGGAIVASVFYRFLFQSDTEGSDVST